MTETVRLVAESIKDIDVLEVEIVVETATSLPDLSLIWYRYLVSKVDSRVTHG